MSQRLLQRLLLPLSLLLLLVAGHLSAFWAGDVTGHFGYMTSRLIQMGRGHWWVEPGPMMDSGINLVSPLYSWFYAPVLLAENPIIGLWFFYLLLELLSLSAFLFFALRFRLMAPALAWTAALLLCLEPLTKMVKTENLTVAVHLTTPMFVLFLAGLSPGRSVAMMGAGLLLGMAAQIHISALFCAPVLLLAVVRWSPRSRASFLSLAAGFALVLPISLLSITWGGVSTEAALQGSGMELWPLLQRLGREAPGPLTLAGAVITALVLVRNATARGGAPDVLTGHSRAGRLALGWSVSVFVLLTLALELAGSAGPAAPRYLALRPAGALLGAVALTWFAARLHELAGSRLRLAPLTAVSLLALGLLGHGAWAANTAWDEWAKARAVQKELPLGLACTFPRNNREGRYMDLMYRALTEAGVATVSGEITAVVGHEQRGTTDLVSWARRNLPARTGDPKLGQHLLVTWPIPGLQNKGELLVIPGVKPLPDGSMPHPGLLQIPLPPTSRQRRLLLLLTIAGQKEPITLAGANLNQCPTELHGEPTLLVTALLEPNNGNTLRLHLGGLTGKVKHWQILALPHI